MRVAASPQAVELVRNAGNRLYVWPTCTPGCQPMTHLEADVSPPTGETFHRADFAPFELYLVVGGRWPDELELDVSRGRIRALWDGAAWKIHY
jgi:hypothetical protein